MLLTYADHCAVGPGVWNEWKADLLWELYSQARGQLTGAAPVRWDADQRRRVRQRLVEELAPRFARSVSERHLALMPDRYLRSASAERAGAHLQMAARLDAEPLVAEWGLNAAGHFTSLTVCARDARGLLARLAGTLSARGLNILSVDVLTREDGVIFDSFKVCEVVGREAVRPERWDVIQADLSRAVTGELDVDQAVLTWRSQPHLRLRARRGHRTVEPRIHFDSEASEQSTVVEVVAEDQPGLVYTIAHTLMAQDMSINFAKIATEKSQALDVFYVTDAQGLKLSEERRTAVAERMLEALRELSALQKQK
jgi:[protein-PII] uridylyltransferase